MKNIRRIFIAPWRAMVISFLLVAHFAAADTMSSLSDFKPVTPGLDYLHVTDADHPWSIHIARVDRTRADFDLLVTHARNQITALATVPAQIDALPAGVGKPFVAVNADFFVIAKVPSQGDPLGLQIIDGELSSAPNGATFWTEPGGKYFLNQVVSRFTVTWPHGGKSAFALNAARPTNGIALYTPNFGATTLTTNGLEFVLEPIVGQPWLPLRADETYSARVREVRVTPNTSILPGTMILSLAPELTPHYVDIKPDSKLRLSTGTTPNVSRARYAVGGRPILLNHGRIPNFPPDKSGKAILAPRTAIGWNDHYFYFVVVDGRQKTLSMGMTLAQMAVFMKQLGCAEAVNLDGGGSTTFWLDGKILNSPSDKHLRTVANSLILVKHSN